MMSSKPQIVANTVRSSNSFAFLLDQNFNDPTSNTDINQKQCVERKGKFNQDLQCAWIWDTSKLLTISTKKVEKIGSWTFGALLKESRTKITCVIDLEGLENFQSLACVGLSYRESQGMVCIMAAASSMIWGAISLPCEVTSLCVIDSGANIGRCNPLHPELQQTSGLIAVGLAGGIVILLDLRRNDVEAWPGKEEVRPAEIVTINKWDDPALVAAARKKAGYIRGHLAFLLHEPSKEDTPEVTSLLYAPQICSLIMGFSSGQFQIWNLNTMALEVCSEHRPQPITDLLLLQPENDPRNMCYLWVVESGDFHSRGSDKFSIGRLYALVYDTKEVIETYGTLYQDLVSMTAVFIFEMSSNSTSMRGSRCLSLHHLDSANLNRNIDPAEVEETGGCNTLNSLCTFTWEVWDATAISYNYWCAVFDLNLWYNNEMPTSSTLRGHGRECNYLICSSLSMLDTHPITNCILDAKVCKSTVQRYTSIVNPEEASYPSALTFDLVCVLGEDMVVVHHPGVQKHLLTHFEKYLAPEELMSPDNLFAECLHAGLRPYGHDQIQISCSHEEKLRMLLSIPLEQGYVKFLQNCARTWAGGNYSFGGCTLSVLMDWAWKQTGAIKTLSEQLVIPLFDGWGQILDIKSYLLLKRCCSQFETLRTLFTYILESNLLPLSDVAEEMVQRTQVLSLMKLYTDVVLWAYDMGLLPENGLPNNTNHPNIPYPLEEFTQSYKKRRESLKEPNMLLIDCLMDKCGTRLKELWQREGGLGTYPPPTVRALLLTYLLGTVPTDLKHCLVIYFFFDLAAHHGQNQELAPQITHIVHFPSSFELRPSLIKLMQAVWHLDHDGVDTSMDMLQSPMIINDDIIPWRAHILQLLLKMGHKQKALGFIRNRQTCVASYEAIKFEMCLLLENKFLDEALYHQRRIRTVKLQHDVLTTFLTKCHEAGLMKDLLTLALDPVEEEAVVDFLEIHDKSLAVMYLLMKNRFIEAYQMKDCKEVSKTVRKVLEMYNENLPQITQDLAKLCHTMPKDFCGWSRYDPLTSRRPLSTKVTMSSTCAPTPQMRSSALCAVISGICTTKRRSFSSVDIPARESSKRKLAAELPLSNSYNYLVPHTISAMEIPRDLAFETPAKKMRFSEPAGSPSTSMTQLTKITSKEALTMLVSPHIKRRTSTSQNMDLDDSLTNVPSPHSILKVRTPKQSDSAEKFHKASDVYVFRATSSQAPSASPKQLRFEFDDEEERHIVGPSTSSFTPSTSKSLRSVSRGRVKSRRSWVTPKSSMSLRSASKSKAVTTDDSMDLTLCQSNIEEEISSDEEHAQSMDISVQNSGLWDNIMAVSTCKSDKNVTTKSDNVSSIEDTVSSSTDTCKEKSDSELGSDQEDRNSEKEDENVQKNATIEEKLSETVEIEQEEEDFEEIVEEMEGNVTKMAEKVQNIDKTREIEGESLEIEAKEEEMAEKETKLSGKETKTAGKETKIAEKSMKMREIERETEHKSEEEAEKDTEEISDSSESCSSNSVTSDKQVEEESLQSLKYCDEDSSDDDVIVNEIEKEFKLLDEMKHAGHSEDEEVVELSDEEDVKKNAGENTDLSSSEDSCTSSNLKSTPETPQHKVPVSSDSNNSSASSNGLLSGTLTPTTYEKFFFPMSAKSSGEKRKTSGSDEESTPSVKRRKESPEVLQENQEKLPEIVDKIPKKSEENPEIVDESPEKFEKSPEIVDKSPEKYENSPEVVDKSPEKYENSPEINTEFTEEIISPEISGQRMSLEKGTEVEERNVPVENLATPEVSSVENIYSSERDISTTSSFSSPHSGPSFARETAETTLPPKYTFPGIFGKRQSPSSSSPWRNSPDVYGSRQSPNVDRTPPKIHLFGQSPKTQGESSSTTKLDVSPRVQPESSPRFHAEVSPRVPAESSPRVETDSIPRSQIEASPIVQTESSQRIQLESSMTTQAEVSSRVQTRSSPRTQVEVSPPQCRLELDVSNNDPCAVDMELTTCETETRQNQSPLTQSMNQSLVQESINPAKESMNQSLGQESMNQSLGQESMNQSMVQESISQSPAIKSISQSPAIKSINQSPAIESMNQSLGQESINQSLGQESMRFTSNVEDSRQRRSESIEELGEFIRSRLRNPNLPSASSETRTPETKTISETRTPEVHPEVKEVKPAETINPEVELAKSKTRTPEVQTTETKTPEVHEVKPAETKISSETRIPEVELPETVTSSEKMTPEVKSAKTKRTSETKTPENHEVKTVQTKTSSVTKTPEVKSAETKRTSETKTPEVHFTETKTPEVHEVKTVETKKSSVTKTPEVKSADTKRTSETKTPEVQSTETKTPEVHEVKTAETKTSSVTKIPEVNSAETKRTSEARTPEVQPNETKKGSETRTSEVRSEVKEVKPAETMIAKTLEVPTETMKQVESSETYTFETRTLFSSEKTVKSPEIKTETVSKPETTEMDIETIEEVKSPETQSISEEVPEMDFETEPEISTPETRSSISSGKVNKTPETNENMEVSETIGLEILVKTPEKIHATRSSENVINTPEIMETEKERYTPKLRTLRSTSSEKVQRSSDLDPKTAKNETEVGTSTPRQRSTRSTSSEKVPKSPEIDTETMKQEPYTPRLRSTRSASSEKVPKYPEIDPETIKPGPSFLRATRSRSSEKVPKSPETFKSEAGPSTLRATRSRSTEKFRRASQMKTEVVIEVVQSETLPEIRPSKSTESTPEKVKSIAKKVAIDEKVLKTPENVEDLMTEDSESEEEEIQEKLRKKSSLIDESENIELGKRRLTRYQMSVMKKSQLLLGKSNYNDLTDTENRMDSPRRSQESVTENVLNTPKRSQKSDRMSISSSHKGKKAGSVSSVDSNDSRYVTRSMAARIGSIQEFVSLPNMSPRARRTQSPALVDVEEKRVTRSRQKSLEISPSRSVVSSVAEDLSDDESVKSRSSVGSRRKSPVPGSSKTKKKSQAVLQPILEMSSKDEEDVSRNKGDKRTFPETSRKPRSRSTDEIFSDSDDKSQTDKEQNPGVSFEFSLPHNVSGPEILHHSDEDRIFEFSPPVQKKKPLLKFIEEQPKEESKRKEEKRAGPGRPPGRKPTAKKEASRLTRFSVARKKSSQ